MGIIRHPDQSRSQLQSQPRQWIDSEGKFIFGKHAGESIESVVTLDFAYVKWAVENAEDMDEEDIKILSQHLTYRRR